jgi:hypothetical protein
MEDMKHFAEAVGRSTPYKLDKEFKQPTVKTVQNKMQRFISVWERKTGLKIPPAVHDSVAPVSMPVGQPTVTNTSCERASNE